jgi:hypothetical protein
VVPVLAGERGGVVAELVVEGNALRVAAISRMVAPRAIPNTP